MVVFVVIVIRICQKIGKKIELALGISGRKITRTNAAVQTPAPVLPNLIIFGIVIRKRRAPLQLLPPGSSDSQTNKLPVIPNRVVRGADVNNSLGQRQHTRGTLAGGCDGPKQRHEVLEFLSEFDEKHRVGAFVNVDWLHILPILAATEH